MARRRRRWVFRFGLVVLLVVILGWPGLGLLSSDDEGDGAAETSARAPAKLQQTEAEPRGEVAEAPLEEETADVEPVRRPGARDSEDPQDPPDGRAVHDPTGNPEAGTADSGNADTGRAETGALGGGPGGEERADRIFVLRELIAEAVATDRLGDGFRALQDLEEITRADGPQDLRAEGQQALGSALTATVLQLRQLLAAGRVLEARRLLGALRATPHPRVLQALDKMAGGQGWPPLGPEPAAGGGIPVPLPLQGERRVLLESGGHIAPGRVAECRGDTVTVRLQREDGVVFPTLSRALVQPVDPNGEESVQQGFAALRAGDRDLAWLWLCRAHAEGAAGDPLRQLANLVGG